jgi:predicted Rossmann-fold nucleotide-binding protein
LADCFVCLPGSYGTLDEMMDVIASGTIHEHNKPIYILNYKGFYEGLKVQVNHMRELCFLPMVEQYTPVFVDTIDELIQQLGNYDKNA